MKKEKIRRSPKQRFMIFLRILLIFILLIAIVCAVGAIASMASVKSNSDFISAIKKVEYENQLVPEKDDKGYTTFVTDDDFKIMQLTDVHIGGGWMSKSKDTKAINAVAAMVTAEKPDLVIATGDIAYPVPFQAGTFNNKSGAKLFAQLMEQLGVYWCVSFGNHDTEAYSYFNRSKISDFYENEELKYCLFETGDENIDGYGNYVINVKNTQGKITQSLFVFDTGAYVDDDYLGIMWKYDTIHENQIQWYENTLNEFKDMNNGEMPKSLAFFHIPVQQYRDGFYEYVDNGLKDTENVKFLSGKAGESGSVVYTSVYDHGFFDKAKELGSTTAMFCGHDHYNNFSLNYKGIDLNYGYSIDYLAYIGISGEGSQRGCSLITVKPDGTHENRLENYYQDKYVPVNPKEEVTMQPLDTVTYEVAE